MATSDDKNTNLLNDELSRSRIGITLRGTAKSEEIKGTSRNDVLDGGAGSDNVDAGSGNDLLIYRLSENTGARDRYDGGSGVDTLRLEFTAAEWARADVRADITRFLTVLQKVTVRGEETEGNSNWFSFKAFGLEVRKIELLEIRVDGVVVDPLGNTSPAPVANADVANVAEGAAVSGNVLANDQATNATVSLVSNVTRGTLVLNANGSYTFTAGPAFDALAAGQSTTETFTYRITDAQGRTATAGVTITVAGSNDAAIIIGTSTASLTETNAAQSTSGQLNVTDVDGAASFITQSGTVGQYGSFSIDATGAWTYTMGSAHDEFVAGQTYSDSFTVATADGTTQVVTVNIAGSNDAAVISGFFTGSIETDAPLTITGKLDVTDIDGPDEFVAQSGIAGVNGRGSFAIDTTGNWTFTANSAFNELAVGQYLIDYAEVSAADGTKQLISITINGSNDGPVISGGMISGAVTEDTALTASGQLTANDADAGATQTWSVQGTATGVYGSFAVDQAGQWTYTLDNANHQDLAAGESHVETFTVRVTDEHGAYADQAVSVTVNGSNDEAVISGFFTGSIETDAPLTITGKLDVSDIDGPDEFIAQSGIAGINGLGSFAIDTAGNWVFNANSAFNELAVGQYIYDYAEVSTADGTRLYLSITINGTNDGAVITGDSTASITESNVAQTASGQLSVSDIDSPETVVAQTGTAGQYGSFSIDATGAWTYTMGSAHDEFVAGQTYSDSFTVATADGTTQAVTVTINGTNDSPVITGGAQSGAVTEDGLAEAVGQLTATDPDTGAQQFWAVEGGTPAGNADFQFRVDSLTLTRNGATIFQDNFSDGIAPPIGPDGVTEGYGGFGSAQFTESGGRLLLDSAGAESLVGLNSTDPVVGMTPKVRTNINPANTTSGLKSTANFTASAVFDLILPDSPRENYGLRFTDRVVGGNGTPPDQLGDNVVDFRVAQRVDGSLVVRLQQRSFVDETVQALGSVALTPPAGADQIRLNLAHATAHVGQVVASFDYLAAGSVVGSYTFTATGTIFEGENFTRAEIIASAPAINDSAIGGTYGTLNVDQTGTWTYTLNDGLATTQSLAAGQTAFDTFTLQVTDENGASDSETVTITVTGTNDTPEVQTGTVSRVLAEDAAASLTASGAGQFADVDLTDTHTVAAVLTSAGLNNSATLPAGLQALLADAVAVTLQDVATGDAHGQYLWDFALANSAVQFLAAGQTLTLAYDITVTDNHGAAATQRVNVTINGTNDGAVITGDSTASLTETNAVQSTSGQLNVTDVDGAATFITQSGTVGQYGSFSIDATGGWTYTMGSAHDEFVAGQTYSDSFTVATADGATQVVTVNIAGSNDAAVISGFVTGHIETDAPLTITGKFDVSDIDGPDEFIAQSGIAGINGLGSFAIDAAGNWTFTANSAFNELAVGQYIHDYAEVSTADGTKTFLDVTINGSNDGPVISSGVISGAVTEDTALTASGQLTANDADAGATQTWSVQGGATGVYGSFAVDQAGQWTYTLDNANHQDLAAGESHVETFTVRVTDEHGAYADQAVSVTVNGSNDAAVISGFFTGSIETNAPLTITGKLDVSDIDGPDEFVAQSGIAGVNGRGSFAIDAAGNWTFIANSAFNELAVGQYLIDYAEVSAADGTKQLISITINGTNDGPVITGGTQNGAVTEDVADIATGQLTATDPDTGARQFWTVEGGTPAGNADFLFKADSLTITRNGATLFQDTFSDGIAPPVGPDGVTESYGGVGSVQLTESGGKLLLDSDAVQSFVGIANSDPTVGVNAIAKTNINPASTNSGLKSTANFTASAVFDLILPDSPRENYGLRFTDRVVGGNGTPPDQLGDNVVDFRVSMREDGSLAVRLQQRSFVADTKLLLEAVALTPPVGADQIRLNLAHATAHVGQVVASFDYLAAGSVVGSYTFTATGTIFQGENFTRAEIIASAPAINDSAIGGTYGTLNVDQTGTWTYTLNDGLATTQSLAAGQTAFDTFTLQVTDENGASDSETVTITVTGTNDTPEVQTGTVSRVLAEDAAASLTASGAGQFADVDLTDTHTVAAVLTSAGLNNSATLPAGLQALLANAVAVTLPDVATGDAHGQYLWDFAVANSAVQFLAAGQTLTLAYDIAVTDNHGAAATQRVNVTITGANDAPVITSAATATFAENATGTVYTATATDADSAVLSYTIGGTDAALFNINATTGAVSFKNAPNYEAPADVGGNNVYDITVSASDGVNSSAAQGVAISVTDVLESLAGQSVIDLGSFGKLIAPVQVDGGKWYYYWDRSGNGTNTDTGTLNGGVDYTTHDVLDGIFNKDINGVVGGGGNTTDTYRYATLNGVQVALPTAGGQSSPPYGSGGINNFQPGTTVGTSPAASGSNAVNATYNDLLAVWDAYNGTGTGIATNGTPSGWRAGGYWSATPSASGHALVYLIGGDVYDNTDNYYSYVALQVL